VGSFKKTEDLETEDRRKEAASSKAGTFVPKGPLDESPMMAPLLLRLEVLYSLSTKKAASVSRGSFGLSCGGDHWSPRE
jgi:hypothetical protein